MRWEHDTQLEPRIYTLEDTIEVAADGITIDGRGAVIVGAGRSGSGIRLQGRKNVTLRSLTIIGYTHGIEIDACESIHLEGLRVTGTDEMPPNTDFLNIFHPTGSYPGGILLKDSENIRVTDCDLSHQMSGLLSYGCRNLSVENCTANYCSGFGFYLSSTFDSRFKDNCADFCCRWNAREGGTGHMGADAAGFVIVNGSSRNTFRDNLARMGGDGFFLAGLRHDGVFKPCNDNLFEDNDASHSPNISFEATFSSGNVFRRNRAVRSNYGFWLGFSRDNLLEENDIIGNLQAGIAVENGIDMTAKGNRINGNGQGILLWSKRIPQFDRAVPENDTSREWHITGNRFARNGRAIRIAADQDHGLRPYTENGTCPPLGKHRIENNTFDSNRIDLDIPEDVS